MKKRLFLFLVTFTVFFIFLISLVLGLSCGDGYCSYWCTGWGREECTVWYCEDSSSCFEDCGGCGDGICGNMIECVDNIWPYGEPEHNYITETTSNCPSDCESTLVCNNDGDCDWWETMWTCPHDCCTNECSSGQRICSGTGYKTCGNYDSDVCLEWSSVTNCPSGTICESGYCESCSCTSWVNGICGAGSCSTNQRQQTRTCTPSGCAAESQCIVDTSCGGGGTCSGTTPLGSGVIKGPSTYSSGYTPTSWIYTLTATSFTPCKWKCDSGYTRSGNGCVPSGGCSCGPWTNAGCNTGGCTAPTRRLQTRTCSPSGCAVETQCVVDAACILGCPGATCESLGYECGTHSICTVLTYCGDCSERDVCEGTTYKDYSCQTGGGYLCILDSSTDCDSRCYSCGDGNCNSDCGETEVNCVEDCCIPDTCESLGYECDSYPDGCGGTLNCGDCETNERCINNMCEPVCVINDARWSKNNANEDENVEVIIETNSICEGLQASFVVMEDDTIGQDDIVNTNPLPVVVEEINGDYKAISNWVVEYQSDGIFGDPEYYFIATIVDPIIGNVEKQSDLLYVGSGLGECGDDNLDQGETCYNCPDDAGCHLNEDCEYFDNEWICTKQCDKMGLGNCYLCNDDGVCNIGEDCLCDDCLEEQDSCFRGLICNSTYVCDCNSNADEVCSPECALTDPDCCDFTQPEWEWACIGEGQTNKMSVYGVDCGQTGMEFKVHKDGLLSDPLIETINPVIEDGVIWAEWVVESDGEDNEYYFTIGEGNQKVQSDNIVTKPCDIDNDWDCDGICNPGSLSLDGKCDSEKGDMCPDTEPCAEVDDNGCSPGQLSCLSRWDCSGTSWTDCNPETGLMTRVRECISPSLDDPDECWRFTPPNLKQCLKLERFPGFTLGNAFVVVLLLMIYYIFKKKTFF